MESIPTVFMYLFCVGFRSKDYNFIYAFVVLGCGFMFTTTTCVYSVATTDF